MNNLWMRANRKNLAQLVCSFFICIAGLSQSHIQNKLRFKVLALAEGSGHQHIHNTFQEFGFLGSWVEPLKLRMGSI